jgi:hypothetical protein
LFGFGSGIGLGLVTAYLISCYGHPGPRLNRLLALGSVGLVLLAWWAALQS